MFTNPENKKTISIIKQLLTEANNVINKTIAENDGGRYDIDRQKLRSIRDKNIETYCLITRMEMQEMIL